MICEKCNCKSECEYYSTNIEPVLNTEQGMFTGDEYLFALFKCLDAYTCDCYEPQESEEQE